MHNIPSHRLISWVIGLVLGSLPFVVNFITHYAVGDMSFNSLFRVSELMCYCILLNVTTMHDLFSLHGTKRNESPWRAVLWFGLLVMTLLYAVILGISSFFTAVQPVLELYNQIELRLSGVSVMMVIFTLISDVALQIYVTSQSAER